MSRHEIEVSLSPDNRVQVIKLSKTAPNGSFTCNLVIEDYVGNLTVRLQRPQGAMIATLSVDETIIGGAS